MPGAEGTADLSCGGIGTPGKNVDSGAVDSSSVDVSDSPDSPSVLGNSVVTEGVTDSDVGVTPVLDGTTGSVIG